MPEREAVNTSGCTPWTTAMSRSRLRTSSPAQCAASSYARLPRQPRNSRSFLSSRRAGSSPSPRRGVQLGQPSRCHFDPWPGSTTLPVACCVSQRARVKTAVPDTCPVSNNNTNMHGNMSCHQLGVNAWPFLQLLTHEGYVAARSVCDLTLARVL